MPLPALSIGAVISVILGALFTPIILRQFGIEVNPNSTANGFEEVKSLLQALPGMPEAKEEEADEPSGGEILQDAVNQPISLFGIAAVGFVSVFVIAQIRAAGHEVTTTGRDVLRAGGRVKDSLANADRGTDNLSRYLRK